MKTLNVIRLLLGVAFLLNSLISFGFETDQFNLPPEPLVDVGDEVSQYTEENIRVAIEKINAEIALRENCLANSGKKIEKIKCVSPAKESVRLNYLRSEAAVVKAVFEQLGAGIPPFTTSEVWMNSHKFAAQPARYKTTFSESIFALNPVNYLTISPTVNLYGAQFGTDKVAHLFQQGFTYYQKYKRGLIAGLTLDEASRKAIQWGQMTERTFYGTLISGVYSNADLCANFVGMKFYQGLTREINIGDRKRPAILRLENGFWKLNENAELKQVLLKPFISNHFNEALNSSKYASNFGFRSFVRQTVRMRSCPGWLIQNPGQAKTDFLNVSQGLKLWYGEDYGFSESKNFITIANTCFE